MLKLTVKSVCLSMAMAAAISLLCIGQAKALDLSSGEVEASFDTTISYGVMFRVEKQDQELTSQVNDNDGDLNYKRGIVSNAAKFTSDFDLGYRNFGLFLRATGFFDYENEQGDRAYRPLSDAAKDRVGNDLALLDAYVTGDFDLDATAVNVRLGQHVLNWGESTFIPNGISVINPVDVTKVRVPGAELREALVPVPMASVAVELPNNLSFEGFYQIQWEKTEIDPVGTYFSTTDYVGLGASKVYINHPDLVAALAGNPFNPMALGDDPELLDVVRGPERHPDDEGQGGVALRYLAEGLNNTEFGLYFINYHSRLPSLRAHSGTMQGASAGLQAMGAKAAELATALMMAGTPQAEAAQLAQNLALPYGVDAYADTGYYFIEYPRNIRLFGLSFNTLLGASGWALQGEYSFRNNVPLQIAELTVLEKGLAPFFACINPGVLANLIAAGLITNPANASAECVALGAPGTAGYDVDIPGYLLLDVSQVQATATRLFGPAFGADALAFVVEAAMLHVHDMPAVGETPLESPAEGTPEDGGASDATSFGYRMAIRLDYGSAIGAANLYPYVQFQHDFSGNSPAPIGPFVEGRTAWTVGLRVDYLSRWEGRVSYTAFDGSRSEMRDRDFVTATIKYSF